MWLSVADAELREYSVRPRLLASSGRRITHEPGAAVLLLLPRGTALVLCERTASTKLMIGHVCC